MKALRKYIGLLVVALVLAAMALGASATDAKMVAVREMDSLPTYWNPLEAETEEQKFLRSLTGGGMFRVKNRSVESELVTGYEDVTAEYAGSYGVPETAVRGYAFRITLSQDACWDDGTPITADDWIYSGHQMLNMEGSDTLLILANAAGYRNGENRNNQIVPLAEAGYGSVAAAQEAGITQFFVDVEHYWGLGEGWRSVRDITRLEDPAMTRGCAEMYVSAAWLYDRYLADERPYAYFQGEFLGIAGEGTLLTLEDVGLLKTGDHELVLVLEEPDSATALAVRLADFCLIREGTSYRSAMGSASCGPYRIAEASAEAIRLEKNPNWWGEAGQYDEVLCR